jgi:hypothetical protein
VVNEIGESPASAGFNARRSTLASGVLANDREIERDCKQEMALTFPDLYGMALGAFARWAPPERLQNSDPVIESGLVPWQINASRVFLSALSIYGVEEVARHQK